MDNKRVSIIVPVYNVKTIYLDQCISSILDQTHKNIELILVDDGATNNLPALCDEYQKTDPRIVVVHQANAGASSARNAGLDICTGDYVTFVDSDDWIDSNCIKLALDRILEDDLDMLLWGSYKCYETGNDNYRLEKYMPYEDDIHVFDTARKTEVMQKALVGSLPVFKSPATGYGSGSCCSKLYKTEFLKSNNLRYPIGIKRAEDVNFNIRCFEAAKRIGYLNKHFYYYRQLSTSATYQYRENGIQVFTDALNCIRAFIDETHKDDYFYQVYYMRCLFFFLESIDMDYMNPQNKKSLKKRISEMKAIIKTAPYNEAVSKLKYSNLSIAKRIPLFLTRRGLMGTLCLFYKLYSMIK